MTQTQDKPLLFVDIDGVISLWGFTSNDRPAGAFHNVDGIMHFLSHAARIHLHALASAFELVWCSGWEERANEYLPGALGVHALPFLSFERTPSPEGAHWKLAAIDAYAGPSRPLAWIDDAHDDACRAWARARGAPTLLVTTAPATGIGDEHVAALTRGAARRVGAR